MIELLTSVIATILQIDSTSGNNSTINNHLFGQVVPFVSNSQLLMLGQIIIGLLLLAAIMLQLRNLRIGRLLVRDKTIMFAGFLKREDYDRVIKEKGHLFTLVPESELLSAEAVTEVTKQTIITENEDNPGHLKREDEIDKDKLN